MKNWSRHLNWHPNHIACPQSVEAIQELVQSAIQSGRRIRTIGSGHSFVPLSVTEEILLSLDQFQGLVAVNPDRMEVTVRAGTKLHLLGRLLAGEGFAQENMGDIDRQSIAGAISTGTHGTGLSFGNLSTQVTALKWIDGNGTLRSCSIDKDPELLGALALSLGALGILTEVTLRVQPAYKLLMERRKENLDKVLKGLNERNAQHRHFEFYWFPYTDVVQTKTADLTTSAIDKNRWAEYLNDVVLENATFGVLCQLAKWMPRLNRSVSRISAWAIGSNTKVRSSQDAFATPRFVRFNEMEYNIPLSAFEEVVGKIRERVNTRQFAIHFPIEHRFVQADELPLSPANGRDSAYIACHVYRGKPFEEYFQALEEIFIAYDGRPHWGKWHSRQAAFFQEAYPKWQDFLALRKEMDPHGLFLNKYLEKLFFIPKKMD